MRVLVQYFFLVSVLTIVYGQFETENVRSISSGTSFGMCRGHCRQSINMTSNPLQVIASKEANFPQKPYPPIQRQFPLSSDIWKQLVSLLNLKTFIELNEIIGCPDCADGGAEWIEVNWNDEIKRVTFENGHQIQGLEEFIVKLRQIRTEFLSQL